MEVMLNCTRCEAFEEFTCRSDDSDNVVRCNTCGKKHSKNSLHVVYSDKQYKRDEAGELMGVTP